MAANSREARRRKIMERGSDRLALITGRVQSLPSPSASSPSTHLQPSNADADSVSQPLITADQAVQPLIFHPDTSVSPQGKAEESDPNMLKHEPFSDPYHSNGYNSSSQTLPLHNTEHENEFASVSTSKVEQVDPPPDSSVVASEINQVQPPTVSSHVASEINQVQPPTVSSHVTSEIDQVQPTPDSSVVTSETEQQSQLQCRDPKIFSPSQISSAITASKITRLCCSTAVALLVVLSYLGFPLLDSKYVKSILSFRPLYLVLVTNITVVVAQLLSGKQRGSERAAGRQNRTSSDGDHWAEQLSRALEVGLVMQNVMDAMFIDCASYAIIVICGLSLVQLFNK